MDHLPEKRTVTLGEDVDSCWCAPRRLWAGRDPGIYGWEEKEYLSG